MLMPPSWFQQYGYPGTCPTKVTDWGNGQNWYTNNTRIPGPPTITDDSPLRTYFNFTAPPFYHQPDPYHFPGWAPPYSNHPWRAPGTAPIFSSCGSDGGNPHGCVNSDGTPTPCAVGGDGSGADAIDAYKLGAFQNVVTTEWKIGSVVEAAWSFWSNHGGGYAYRLCPASSNLTEECFQAGHLDFVGDSHIIQWGANVSSRITIPAMYTKTGTYPPGSHWARVPIPACGGAHGGYVTSFALWPFPKILCEKYPWTPDSCNDYPLQFPAPFPGACGWGNDMYGNNLPFNIVDRLQVPSNLPAGEYVLSFRWDCEQGAQIWNTCANIRLVEHDVEASAARSCPSEDILI